MEGYTDEKEFLNELKKDKELESESSKELNEDSLQKLRSKSNKYRDLFLSKKQIDVVKDGKIEW